MPQISAQRRVQAHLDRVFDVFSNVYQAERRLSGVTKLEVLSDGPVGVGTRWRETRVMFGREAVEEMWIDSFDPPHSYTVSADNNGAHYRTEFTFRPDADGVIVTWTFGAEGRTLFAKIMGLLFAWMTGPVRKMMEKDMDDLQAACEREPVAA